MYGILLRLLDKDKIKAKYLAEEFEVSGRTIYRYLDVLLLSGVPIMTRTGRYGGFYIEDDFFLKKDYLSVAEKAYLKGLLMKEKSHEAKTILLKLF